jgi:5'/3'-nucleotidase SurE
MRFRKMAAPLVAAALVIGGAVAYAEPSPQKQPSVAAQSRPASLRVLLTNDDGWKAPGIRAVYAALTKAGHRVTVVAPLTSQSGMGGRKTFYGAVSVTRPDVKPYGEYAGADVWAVGPGPSGAGGSPADAVMFGLSTVFKSEKPDLVVSGTNYGQNTSRIMNNSGTIGAALEAAETGVPAIAISNEVGGDYSPDDLVEPNYAAASNYLVKIIAKLSASSRKSGDGLMPKGIGMNINVPKTEIKGIKIVESAETDPIATSYHEVEPGVWNVRYAYVGDRTDRTTDVGALAAGYVTVTPVDSDFSRMDKKGWLKPIIATIE